MTAFVFCATSEATQEPVFWLAERRQCRKDSGGSNSKDSGSNSDAFMHFGVHPEGPKRCGAPSYQEDVDLPGGRKFRFRTLSRYLLTRRALGIRAAWSKEGRGAIANWIGVKLGLQWVQRKRLVSIPGKKLKEIREEIEGLTPPWSPASRSLGRASVEG